MTAEQPSIYQLPQTRTNGHIDWPVCTVTQDVYSVRYESITFEFDYIDRDRDGGLWSEMEVLCTTPGMEGPLLRSRVNLIKGNSRRDASKDLASRTQAMNLDWDSMIEEASYWVVDRVRAGEPEIILRDAPEPSVTKAYIPPLLIPDGSTIMFGRGGSLKSYIALALAISLHTGSEIIKGLVPAVQMRVAFVDWEWNATIHRRRMRRICEGAGIELPDLIYVKARAPFAEERDRLRHVIRRQGVEYLILDSAGKACGDDPETAKVANAFFGVLDSLDRNALITSHITKDDAKKGNAEAPFGSNYWENNARSTWFVKLKDQLGLQSSVVGLYHKKTNEERRESPFAIDFAAAEDDGPITMSRIDVGHDPQLSQSLPVKLRIIDFLQGGSEPIHVIADEIGAEIEAVRVALKRGKEKGLFVDFPGPDGIYRWGIKARE